MIFVIFKIYNTFLIMTKRIYSYYFQSASGDPCHVVTETEYKNVNDFLKNEFPAEYEEWVDDARSELDEGEELDEDEIFIDYMEFDEAYLDIEV